jgi:outer membrane lipoprotein
LLIIAATATGCASNIPVNISTAPAGNPTLESVRENSEQYVGTQVRWGGTIARVENKETETWVEIVTRELRKSGQPIASDETKGRFIARINGFLDPAVYEEGRQLTVAGTLEEAVSSRIGQFTYLYPVVRVETFYLWEKEPDDIQYVPAPPWYYDPWYPYRHPYYWYRPPYW